MQSYVHVILAGLSSGMFIWLVASGLTLIFGVLGVLNFAHGSFYMLGAYCSFTVLRYLGAGYWAGLLLGPLAVCAVGFVVERFFLRHVYRIALPYQLLLTFAFVLIFDNLVKIVWGGGALSPPFLSFLGGSVPILGRKFPVYNLFIIAVGPAVAASLGVRVPALFTGVFVFGTWLGALGGGLAVPYVGLLTPGMGDTIIIEAFIVAVIGGLGSLKGAFVGALVIGVLSAFGTRFFPAFDMALTFILMAVVLLWRPQGLFGATR
jgi:branched-chain amino acid transport system permease protein